jgi:putative resolvase
VNLTKRAHARGIRVQTACRWYGEGRLPVPARKAGRLILVSPQTATEAARRTEGGGMYGRVSSHDQRSGLGGQVARLCALAVDSGLLVVRAEGRVGDERVTGEAGQAARGPGGDRRGGRAPDRLGWMNAELVQAALAAHSRRLVVPGDCEITAGLADAMVGVLTLFCAGLCGRRSARNRVLSALGCARQDIGPRAVKLQCCSGGV